MEDDRERALKVRFVDMLMRGAQSLLSSVEEGTPATVLALDELVKELQEERQRIYDEYTIARHSRPPISRLPPPPQLPKEVRKPARADKRRFAVSNRRRSRSTGKR